MQKGPDATDCRPVGPAMFRLVTNCEIRASTLFALRSSSVRMSKGFAPSDRPLRVDISSRARSTLSITKSAKRIATMCPNASLLTCSGDPRL